MGKKKSVVLMILLTIVIVALSAITIFPSFSFGVKKWNPAVTQLDFGADLNGGYYTYYYPEGVIPAADYYNTLETKTGEDATEYQESYVEHKGLFINKDEDFGLCNQDGTLSTEYKKEFNEFVDELTARYTKKGYSDFRVAVVDDYSVLVELPASDKNVSTSLTTLAYTGELTLQVSGAVIDVLNEKDADVRDYIEGFSVKTQYEVAYLQVKLTKAGETAIKAIKSTLSTASDAQGSTDSSSLTSMTLMIGDNQVGYGIFKDYIEGRTILIPEADEAGKDVVETYAIALNSALEKGSFDVTLSAVDSNNIRVIEPVYGSNATKLLYIALAIVLLAAIVVPVIFHGRYGVVNAYTVLSYLIVTGLCFAFISKGVFEITLGSVLVFVAGLALVVALNARMYGAIKKERVGNHKTVESSVKKGYKNCLFGTVDVYVVLILGALALLIGAAGLHTLALQALICFITGAFCNLLWTYAINFVFLSASKNKDKYFRFVMEDDDDE